MVYLKEDQTKELNSTLGFIVLILCIGFKICVYIIAVIKLKKIYSNNFVYLYYNPFNHKFFSWVFIILISDCILRAMTIPYILLLMIRSCQLKAWNYYGLVAVFTKKQLKTSRGKLIFTKRKTIFLTCHCLVF